MIELTNGEGQSAYSLPSMNSSPTHRCIPQFIQVNQPNGQAFSLKFILHLFKLFPSQKQTTNTSQFSCPKPSSLLIFITTTWSSQSQARQQRVYLLHLIPNIFVTA